MHCFEHRDVPALGVCRACGKAVCAECIAGDCPGIACAAGGCAERVRGIDRMLDLNLKLMPRTERLAASAERMSGASERINAALSGAGKAVYVFNYLIGIGAFVGGAVVVWKGIAWQAYVISLLGGLLALIGAGLTIVGARAARAYRRANRDTAHDKS